MSVAGGVVFSSREIRQPGDRSIGEATTGMRWPLIVVRLHPLDFFGDTARVRQTKAWLDALVCRVLLGGRLRIDVEYRVPS